MPYSSADVNAFIAIGMQSGQGSPQTTATKFRFAKYLASDLNVELDVDDIREGGDGLNFGTSYKTQQNVSGQIVVNGRPEIAGQLLALAMGGATWDGGSAPAIHTFNTSHASFPWSTIIAQHPGSALPYFLSDIVVPGFTLEAMSGKPWRFTFPFIGIKHGASMAAFTPTYYGDPLFLYYQSPTYVLDGLGATGLTRFQFGMQLQTDQLQSSDVLLDSIAVLSRDSSLELDRRFENPGLWTKAYYGASGNVQPTVAVATGSFQGHVEYGAAGTLRSLEVNIPLISYRGVNISNIDPDGKTVTETITGKGLQGGTHMAWMQLKNVHASAYTS
jgi:hypothetical protein